MMYLRKVHQPVINENLGNAIITDRIILCSLIIQAKLIDAYPHWSVDFIVTKKPISCQTPSDQLIIYL